MMDKTYTVHDLLTIAGVASHGAGLITGDIQMLRLATIALLVAVVGSKLEEDEGEDGD